MNNLEHMVNDKIDRYWEECYRRAKLRGKLDPIAFADRIVKNLFGKDAKPNYNLRHSAESEQELRQSVAIANAMKRQGGYLEVLRQYAKNHEGLADGGADAINRILLDNGFPAGTKVKCLGIGYPMYKDVEATVTVQYPDYTIGIDNEDGLHVRVSTSDFIAI